MFSLFRCVILIIHTNTEIRLFMKTSYRECVQLLRIHAKGITIFQSEENVVMDKTMPVDLHIHSTASDGTWPPHTLVENVLNAGIQLFAVTDHDSTENISIIKELALKKGMALIPGVEVSAMLNKKTYHILGLGIDPSHAGLELLLTQNRRLMEEKDDEGIRYLASVYPHLVSFQEYLSYMNNPERGGWKSLNYIIDKGLCRNYKEFFHLYSDWQDSFNQVDFPPPERVIATIKEAGGLPVLAHPGSRMYDQDLSALLSGVLEAGIMGLECFHPENSEETTERCLRFCKEHGLRITGGSDCHGDFVGTRKLGLPSITLSMLDLNGISILTLP